MRVLTVVNKRVPENDYRVQYQRFSQVCELSYAMPGKPEAVAPERFVPIGFGESVKAADLVHGWQLFRTLKRGRGDYDLVHFYSTMLILFGPMLAKFAGIPSVITLTGFGRTFNNPRLRYRALRLVYRVLLWNAIRMSRGALFQNRGDQATVEEWYPGEAEKFHYVGSAVTSPVVERKDFHGERLRVLLVTRLLPDKGVDDFLATAEKMHGSLFDFVLVGPESVGYEVLLKRVRDHDKRGVIQYKGELETAATQQEFAQAHILFFPSYGEGMSRVMLEAGFAQVCPIVYEISANRDLIKPGYGFMVKKGDVTQVIQILKSLSKDRKTLEENAESYKNHIIQNFNINIYAKRLDNILINIGNYW